MLFFLRNTHIFNLIEHTDVVAELEGSPKNYDECRENQVDVQTLQNAATITANVERSSAKFVGEMLENAVKSLISINGCNKTHVF